MRRFTVFIAALALLVIAPASALAIPPSATTGPAEEITETTATLTGKLNPNGKGTIFTFDYGETTRYGLRTPESQEIFGAQEIEISAPVEGLKPGTTYHFRLTARNGDGSTTASDGTFTTLGEPPPAPVNRITLSATPPTTVVGFSTVLQGQLSGPGNRGVKVVLQQNPYRYTTFRDTTKSTETDANGIFTFVVFPTVLTRYRVFAEASIPLASDFIEVQTRYAATMKSSARRVSPGSRVTLSGVVKPDHDGMKVFLQRRFGKGRFKTIANTRLRNSPGEQSLYTFKTRVSRTASYRLSVPTDTGHAAVRTRPLTIRAF